MRQFISLCAFLIPLALLTGCNAGPALAPVTGVLTYKGKALGNVHLDFYPENGGRPSWGQTDSEGKFALEWDKDNKGALIGKHKVFAKMGFAGQKIPGENPIPSKELAEFFDKFSATNSKIVVEITASTKEITLAWD